MNNVLIQENTPVGTIVYTLRGSDPENSTVHYGIVGTDRLQVDSLTGLVKLIAPLDREVSNLSDRILLVLKGTQLFLNFT